MAGAANYEKKFREFLDVKRKFIALVDSCAKYHSENVFGQKIRPIGITDNIELLKEAQDLIRQWEKFARFADDQRAAGMAAGIKNDYSPIPFIVSGSNSVSINEGSAQTVSRLDREKILRGLEAKIKGLKRENEIETPEIISCQLDIEKFNKFPEGTIFRRRLSGYNDTLIKAFRLNSADDKTYRVGTYGAIIDTRLLKSEIKYHKKDKKIKSFYDHCTPISCCLYDIGALYENSEVERVKEATTVRKNNPKATPKRKARSVEQIYSQDV